MERVQECELADCRQYRALAQQQRMRAHQESLPNVRKLFEASAARWELLADAHAPYETGAQPGGKSDNSVISVLRTSPGSRPVIREGKLTINCATRAVDVDGVPLRLTETEQAILETLALNRRAAVSKQALMGQIYPRNRRPESKIIDVFVCRLRKKLSAACNGENYIHTLRGDGFMLAEPFEQAKAA